MTSLTSIGNGEHMRESYRSLNGPDYRLGQSRVTSSILFLVVIGESENMKDISS